MRTDKKVLISLGVFLLVLFIFFNTKYFEPWCYEPECFSFDNVTSEELVEKVKTLYLADESFWVWEEENTSEYRLRYRTFTTGRDEYVLSKELLEIFIESHIISIEIPYKRACAGITVTGFCNFKTFDINNKEIVCSNETFQNVNRLTRTKEQETIIQDFENKFIKRLELDYKRDKPSLINIVFARVYLFLHK